MPEFWFLYMVICFHVALYRPYAEAITSNINRTSLFFPTVNTRILNERLGYFPGEGMLVLVLVALSPLLGTRAMLRAVHVRRETPLYCPAQLARANKACHPSLPEPVARTGYTETCAWPWQTSALDNRPSLDMVQTAS